MKKDKDQTTPAVETEQDASTPDITVVDSPQEASAEQQLAEEKEKYLRLAAEYDNFRKRSKAERDSFYARVKAETLKSLLPVYDSVEQAVKHAEQAGTSDGDKQGVALIMKQLLDVLNKNGVTAIDAVGSPFDPNLHNAIAHVDDDTVGDGVIVEELQKGFQLSGEILRHSLVKVAN